MTGQPSSTVAPDPGRDRTPDPGRTRRRRRGDPNARPLAGWLFLTPMIVLLGLFLVLPIVMALYVSFSDWSGNGSPFASGTHLNGVDNYAALLTQDGLPRSDFMTSLRNTFYYVLGVVPLQTILALLLAVLLHQKFLKGKAFFRTAFYFPSVVSSVAISLVFLFLFQGGAVNTVLSWVGIHGPEWFSDPDGLIHLLGDAVGLWDQHHPPAFLTGHSVLGLPLWEWISGPSVALSAIMVQVIWTTAGTFMLLFIAALQDLPQEVEEAAIVDGANARQRFFNVTIPHLRPTILLVVTLGVIGTWQVFDQMYIMTQGGPSKTSLTPAYLSYQTALEGHNWGQGAAMAFLLFLLIFVLTGIQRWLLRDKDEARLKRARRRARRQQKAVA